MKFFLFCVLGAALPLTAMHNEHSSTPTEFINYQAALVEATQKLDTCQVNFLLANNADPFLPDCHNKAPFNYALFAHPSPEITAILKAFLAQKNHSLNTQKNGLPLLLTLFLKHKNNNAILNLLDCDADIFAYDTYTKETCFCFATKHYPEIISVFARYLPNLYIDNNANKAEIIKKSMHALGLKEGFTEQDLSTAYQKHRSIESFCLQFGIFFGQAYVNLKNYLDFNKQRASEPSATYTCPSCSLSIKDHNDFKMHAREAHGFNIFPCSDCTQVFRLPYKLKIHRGRNHKASCIFAQGSKDSTICFGQYPQHDLKRHYFACHYDELIALLKTGDSAIINNDPLLKELKVLLDGAGFLAH